MGNVLNDSIQGRGAAHDPPNRFIPLTIHRDEDAFIDPEASSPQTIFYKDSSRSIIARNDSPDVGFEVSINPYRGCEHGCIYCYARPTHEYLGFSAGLDFETRIMVKQDAPELLRRELMSPKWVPQTLAISGVTDCYQPIERKLELTRKCLQVLAEFKNPVGLITKNRLITRDIDILQQLAAVNAVCVHISVTTLDAEIPRLMEPRASSPSQRLAAIAELTNAGIPVGILMAPVVPGLTDHEIPALLAACKEAGAISAGYVPLRLPFAVAPLFEDWLGRHFPERKDKVLNRIRSMRDGKLNDPNFNTRMQGSGIFAEQISTMFAMGKKRAGFVEKTSSLSTASFARPTGPQLSLW